MAKINWLKRAASVLLSGITAVAMCIPMLVSADETEVEKDKHYYFNTQTAADSDKLEVLFNDSGTGYGGYVVSIDEIVDESASDVESKTGLFIRVDGTNKFYFNKTRFDAASPTVQQNVLKKLVYATNSKQFINAHINEKSIQSMVECMQQRSPEAATIYSSVYLTYTSSPDFINGLNKLTAIIPAWKIVLGVICLIVIMLVAIFTLLDLAFLNAPLLQSKATKDGDKKPGFVSQTAWKAFQDSTQNDKESSGFLDSSSFLYLKSKGVELIIFFACLFFLLFGGIFTVIFKLGDIFAG